MRKRIALIYGGEGRERKISIESAKSILLFINREIYEPIPVHISECGEWFLLSNGDEIPTFPIMKNGISGLYTENGILKIDAAIPALHGDFGEDGKIQGALDTAHIAYVGCGVCAGALTSDKILTKTVADSLGIPTARWVAGYGIPGRDAAMCEASEKFGFPMFIKPSGLGSSIGARRVDNAQEFIAAYEEAASFDGRVLIEELIGIKEEAECAYLDFGTPMLCATGRVKCGGDFYSYEAKYCKASSVETAHGVCDPNAESKMLGAAKRLAEIIGIRHLARIDFFIDTNGRLLFIEINSFLGMTERSLYPLLCEDMGLKPGEFINRLLSCVTDNDRHF